MPGDVVIHSSKLSYLPAFYFDRGLPQSFLLDPPGSSTDTLSPATQEILHVSGDENIEEASAGSDRVWYIVFQQSLDELESRGFQLHPDLDYLNNNFILTSNQTFDDVKLYLYAQPSN